MVCPAPRAQPARMRSWLSRLALLTAGAALVVGTAALVRAARRARLEGAAWSEWFHARGYGEDPYFFFDSGGTSPQPSCPRALPLTIVSVDEGRVVLSSEAHPGSMTAVRCSVRFDRLAGQPAQADLSSNRRMWRLQWKTTE
jgi:hypothetical protein